MKTSLETLEGSSVKVSVSIDAQTIDSYIAKTYKRFASKYSFPGFRKGKAPRPVIDNALGAEAILATVTEDVINDYYPLALDENNLVPAAEPHFEDDDNLVAGASPYTFSFTLDVQPHFELSSYEPVAIELPPAGASESEIADQIEALRQHYSRFEPAPQDSPITSVSRIVLSISATDDAGDTIDELTGEDLEYPLGSDLLPATFDEHFISHKCGDTFDFSFALEEDNFPLLADHFGTTKNIAVSGRIESVKQKVIPQLSDEWAKECFDVENLAALYTQIKDQIEREKNRYLPRLKESRVLDVLADRLQENPPDAMVETQESKLLQEFFTQLQSQGLTYDAYLSSQHLTPEQFKDDIKLQAKDLTKQDLALDAWARHNTIVATDADVTSEFESSGADDPHSLQEQWRKNGRLPELRASIARTKALEDAMAHAEVTEVDHKESEDKTQ